MRAEEHLLDWFVYSVFHSGHKRQQRDILEILMACPHAADTGGLWLYSVWVQICSLYLFMCKVECKRMLSSSQVLVGHSCDLYKRLII